MVNLDHPFLFVYKLYKYLYNYRFMMATMWMIYLTLWCSFVSDSAPTKQTSANAAKGYTYQNPVFEPILADPSVIRDPQSGWFYAYGTQDNWGDGAGTRIVPVLKSSNLTYWTYVGQAFQQKPAWKSAGGIWAPNVNALDNQYVMYYSFSTWGDANPGIGVALASHPAGPFIDKGKLFDSAEIGVPNSIDPHLWEEDGQKFLFWGSYSDAPTQGNYLIALSDDGTKIKEGAQKIKVAAGDIEAVMIHKNGDYYYYFGSKGNCCEGADTKYHVVVARSKQLSGPYLDKQGRPLTDRGSGSLFLKGNAHFVGPGHNAQLITDDEGQDWVLYHAIDPKQGKVSSGATRRMLLMDKVEWIEGWPEIKDQSPSFTPQKAPVFHTQ
jgi:arabinan endo-1,5-alpha-L-arabinosidase